jgi:DNA polymerase III delta prime subunit
MTASHLAELVGSLGSAEPTLTQSIKNFLDPVSDALSATLVSEEFERLMRPPKIRGAVQPNAFVPLRAIKACALRFDPKLAFSNLRSVFEGGLHDQLSFSAIPDSRFDPAELLFCLEGLLLCAPESVDPALFDRVLAVLADKQNTSAHWRPNKPFVASATGSVMLPLSVEGANSLLRSAEIMDRSRRHDLFTSKCVPLLRRFWNWLLARSVQFSREGDDCVGWHSEHVNAADLIHIWDTSQVVEFMLNYRLLLQRHIANTTLTLSGVDIRYPQPLRAALDWTAKSKPDWDDVAEAREPVRKLGDKYKVYKRAGDDFVKPRKANVGTKLYSALLYGPPGTGKTSLAKLVSDALDWPLLTVTVSDFLGSGGAMVEARVKAVFDMLEAQFEKVILFDEIDAFLLDRDSRFYRDQDTIFQFLTPGMLTKLNDLRAAERSIFIIATNYANRIDPAIKRLGRIDTQLLLLPPDRQRRRQMFQKLKLPTVQRDSAAAESLYLGWSDIKAAMAEFRKGKHITDVLEAAVASTGPRHYGRRVWTDKAFPIEEAHCLYKLAQEVGSAKFETDFREGAVATFDGQEFSAEESRIDDLLARIRKGK